MTEDSPFERSTRPAVLLGAGDLVGLGRCVLGGPLCLALLVLDLRRGVVVGALGALQQIHRLGVGAGLQDRAIQRVGLLAAGSVDGVQGAIDDGDEDGHEGTTRPHHVHPGHFPAGQFHRLLGLEQRTNLTSPQVLEEATKAARLGAELLLHHDGDQLGLGQLLILGVRVVALVENRVCLVDLGDHLVDDLGDLDDVLTVHLLALLQKGGRVDGVDCGRGRAHF